METSRQIWLLEELRKSLEKQAELARLGRLGEVERLGLQTRDIVKEIGSAGLFGFAEYQEQRRVLGRLYRNLKLTLSDQMDEIRGELDRLRKGRKTVGVYRRSIQMKEG